MRRWFTRRAISAALGFVAIVVLGTGLIAAPTAHADDPRPELRVDVPPSYSLVALAGPVPKDHGKTLSVVLGAGVVGGVRVTIDTTDAQRVADVRFPGNCEPAGSVATCRFGVIDPWNDTDPETTLPLRLRLKAGVAIGTSAVIRYTVTAPNAVVSPSRHLETRLNVVAGADVVYAPLPARANMTPGSTYPLPFQVRNVGTLAADRLRLSVSVGGKVGEDVELLGNYTNCHYYNVPGYERRSVYCQFDTPVVPGKAYVLNPPLKVRAVTDESISDVHYGWSDQSEDSLHLKNHTRGTSGVLRLMPRPVSQTPWPGNVGRRDPGIVHLHIKDPTVIGDPDVAAVGTTVRADIGKPFDVKVGIRNVGTAQTHQGRDEAAYVEIPEGVHVQRADKRCRRSGPEPMLRPKGQLYRCAHDGHVLPPGGSALFSFRLEVSRPLAETTGIVKREGYNHEGSFNNDQSRLTISTSTPPSATGTPPVSTSRPQPRSSHALPVAALAVGFAAALGGLLFARRRRRAADTHQ
ncbi:hypothetical protein ACH492_33100 [Streptomyces sp. NPDC019443]|uniref:hypothetical protein n=1 Tax=Streptomyces sp. NPDC019443 TaxID=3365061 RepID=UPI0037A02CA6